MEQPGREPETMRDHLVRVRAIFERALEMPSEARPDFLRQACAGDEELLDEAGQLVRAHERSAVFFEQTGLGVGAAAPSSAAAGTTQRRFGPYEIESEIGHGGMGVVYRAFRVDGTFEKKVALKVVRLDVGGAEVMRQFHRERQILATLDHPNIARILDGGETSDGLPYLVMEFVEGEPIDSYVRSRNPGINDRLRLFEQVCAAVEYAHQNLVVHRDLKPGNILVTAAGAAKLLDFGIAKVLSEGGDGRAQTRLTMAALMTPDYASPEQMGGVPVTTATDVYSLGVILFELLTGRSPYGEALSWPALLYAVCEKEPPKPSTISKLGDELDHIVLKALQKETRRRYGSVEQFREDIARYLDGRPVRAQGDSVTYRARKFVRRHRVGVAAAVLAAASLIAGTAVAMWQAKRANSEAASARAVSDFLENDLLAQASANSQAGTNSKLDPNITVRTALDRAAARIDARFKNQPELEASIRHTIGRTYTDLGLYPEAQRQLERAVELRRRALGARDADTLESIDMLAAIYHSEGKYAQAEPLYREALEGRRRSLGEDNKETLSVMSNLAWLYRYQGKNGQAEQLFKRVLEKRRRVLGPEDPQTLASMDALASIYQEQGRYKQAEPLMIEALDQERRVLGEEHPGTLISLNNVALLYREEGKFAQAEPLYQNLLDTWRRVLGPRHPDTLTGMSNLAMLYMDEGKYSKAEALFIEVLDTRRRVLGDEHPDVLSVLNNLAALYRCEGRYSEAETLNSKALEARRRVLGETHPDTLGSLQNLARLYLSEGKLDQSAALFANSLAVQRRAGREADPTILASLAQVRLKQQRYTDAEPLLRGAMAGYEKHGADVWRRFAAESMLGMSLAGQKRYAEAEAMLLSGYTGLAQRAAMIPASRRTELDDAANSVVQLYRDWGKPERLVEWRAKLGR